MTEFKVGETVYWVGRRVLWSGEVASRKETGGYKILCPERGEIDVSDVVLRGSPELALIYEISYRRAMIRYEAEDLAWASGQLALLIGQDND